MKRLTKDIISDMTQNEAREAIRDMRKECHTCYQVAQMVGSPEYQQLLDKIGKYAMDRIADVDKTIAAQVSRQPTQTYAYFDIETLDDIII